MKTMKCLKVSVLSILLAAFVFTNFVAATEGEDYETKTEERWGHTWEIGYTKVPGYGMTLGLPTWDVVPQNADDPTKIRKYFQTMNEYAWETALLLEQEEGVNVNLEAPVEGMLFIVFGENTYFKSVELGEEVVLSGFSGRAKLGIVPGVDTEIDYWERELTVPTYEIVIVTIQPPQNLCVDDLTDTAVSLDWDAPTEGPAPVLYRIYKDGESLGTVTTTSVLVDELDPETTYTFMVEAQDEDGNTSEEFEIEVTTLPLDMSWWEDEVLCGNPGPETLELTSEATEIVLGGKYWVQDSSEGTDWSVLIPAQDSAGCIRSEWSTDGENWDGFGEGMACVSAGVQATLAQNLGEWCGGRMRYYFVPTDGGDEILLFEMQTR